ncbi:MULTISPECIES: MFS transporter [Gordonia]|uniref:Putative drug resistance protein n=1 Tax=Gordonia sihwensis NBRC 108236 TaxID=1223544 RepID=L7LI32_9ACTN|nr:MULTISPECIES: MFS transporter [Gordonia]AUH70322.1 MFS transporter [Gordonia sp. YC-JH1]MBY4570702.1 MFS transporter [Gordonia sihwensis]WFN94764.1 MFS transporter [Gordonia sihwensis]GAC59723.1 putative drug resistance protein [Gordonia sihwensis NBRC 108236]
MSVPAAEPVTEPDPRRWKALVFICLAQLMVVLDGTVVNIALPDAKRDLGISTANQQWVITAYALAFGGLLLFGGRVADMWGRRRALMIGLVGFACASAVGGAAVNEAMLFAARAVQGAFGALLAPAALSLLTVMFTQPKERARAFGVFGAIAGGGAAVGLLLGGLLTQVLDWRWTMYINVAIAAVALLGAVFEIKEPPRSTDHVVKLDVLGVVLGGSGLALVVYGFSRAAEKGWADGGTLTCLVAAVVLLALFVGWQWRYSYPLLPLRVVADRSRGGAYLTVALSVIAMFGSFLFLTLYMQTVHHYTPLSAGFAFLPMVFGMLIGSTQVAARLITRVPPRYLLVPGALLGSCAMLILAQVSADATRYWSVIFPGLIILGFGMGTVFMTSMNLATFGVAPYDAGVASAMVNTSQQVGGAVGTALLNTIAANAAARYITDHRDSVRGPADIPHFQALAMVHGDSVGFYVAAAILAFVAVVAGLLINVRHPLGLNTASPEPAAAPV